MVRLSLCIITKPDEWEILDRCLGYVAEYVDEICITVTGSSNRRMNQLIKKYNAKVSYFEWNNSFADARNFNFSQASGEYIMWLDTDDAVRDAENMPSIMDSMQNRGADGGVVQYLYHFDQFKNCDVTHRKTRIIKNDGCMKWVGDLHEDLIAQREIVQYFVDNLEVLHLTDDQRVEESKQRNLDIALSVLKKNNEDPTNHWNVANSYMGLGNSKEAIKHFEDFIQLSGSEDEITLAYYRMAGCYMDQKNPEKAFWCASKVVELRPWFPDGYLLMGEIFYKTNRYKQAKELLVTGLSKDLPQDEVIVWNPRDYDFNPLLILGYTYIELGDPVSAKKCFEACLKIFPKHEHVQHLLKVSTEEVAKLEKIDKICEEVSKINDIEKIKELLDEVPIELRSHPKIALIRNVHFIKKESSGKDLAIFCFSTAERFNPELIMKRGTGGSEEAVYQISSRLAKLGWNVTVYANCGDNEQWYDGVLWKPWWEFNARDNWDIVISWRHPLLAQFDELKTDNLYIWLHDVVKESEFTAKRLKKIKKIIVLSKYQRDLFPNIPDDKFIISSNGIDAEMFEKKRGTIERNPKRIIYTSSYDRGLKTLLKLFPRIRAEVPDAELHIFYGWDIWDSLYSRDPGMMKIKADITALMDQPGVIHHGRASQEQIVDEYFKSSILAYPTEFTEISYISGMKAQAAGCVPVVTGIYALDETIQFGLKVNSKEISTDENAQEEWVNGVISLLKRPPSEEERTEMMKWAVEKFNWKSIAKQWTNDFKEKQ